MRRLLLPLLLVAGPALAQAPAAKPDAAPASPPDTWIKRDVADVTILDKVNAKAVPLTLKVGQAADNGTMSIALRSCLVRPPDMPADSAAYFDIDDSRPGAPGFHGWILANEPAVSMLQHPIFDIRLVGCH